MTYISLFSSAGIGCFGFKLQKFTCVATVEFLAKRMAIQRANKKCTFESGYIQGDITLPSTKDKIYKELEKNHLQSVDVIIATPPCQGMSVANHHKVEGNHTRNSLVVESLELTKKIAPKFFVFENVRAFLKSICTFEGENISIDDAINRALESNYKIESRIINFKDYGANSSRTRTLVIGVRKDLKVLPSELFPERKEFKSLKEVLKNLPSLDSDDKLHTTRKLEGRYLEWIKNTPEGKSAFDNEKEEHRPHKIVEGKIVPNKKGNLDKYKRCEWSKVAPCVHTRNDTISSQSTLHPEEHRVFSIRELMLMMNIPSSFVFEGSEQTIRGSIGEAVPTTIFEQIAKKIGLKSS